MNKNALKESALAALRAGGGFYLSRRSRWRKERLLILCYHGFTLEDEHEWNGYLYLSRERFRERLELLKQGGYNVLRLDEAFTRLQEGSLPERSVVITVDDGTYDFYRTAYPLLQEYRFPATVYLTTYYCLQNDPVFMPALLYLLWKSGKPELDAGKWVPGQGSLPLRNTAERLHAGKVVLEWTARQNITSAGKTELLMAVAADLGASYEHLKQSRQFHVMNPEEVREISRDSAMDIELHTHRHRTPLDRDLFLREIRDNRRAIEEITGRSTRHFCYPSGQYDASFLPWLREEGVITATTCRIELADRTQNPLLLPRYVDTMYQSRLRFESWCSGAARLLPRSEAYRYEEASE